MGFSELHPITNQPKGMPDYWFERHQGYLAIRKDFDVADQRWSHQELLKDFGPVAGVESPQLVKSLHGYNIVTFKGKVFGIPQSLGSMDIAQVDMASLEGVIPGLTVRSVQKEIESRLKPEKVELIDQHPSQQETPSNNPPAGVEPPQLVESLHGYNIVKFKGNIFGIPQSLGSMDIAQVDIASMSEVITGATVKDVQKAIQRHRVRNSSYIQIGLGWAKSTLAKGWKLIRPK